MCFFRKACKYLPYPLVHNLGSRRPCASVACVALLQALVEAEKKRVNGNIKCVMIQNQGDYKPCCFFSNSQKEYTNWNNMCEDPECRRWHIVLFYTHNPISRRLQALKLKYSIQMEMNTCVIIQNPGLAKTGWFKCLNTAYERKPTVCDHPKSRVLQTRSGFVLKYIQGLSKKIRFHT